jgi:hypothetical protein
MKTKSILFILTLACWIQLGQTNATAASEPCPAPFQKVAGKPCCTFKPECPKDHEISQDCGTPSGGGVQLTFCCVKKKIPFDCPKPAETVMLTPEKCKSLKGKPDPNYPSSSTVPVPCCFNCSEQGAAYAMIEGTVNKEKCQPIPPNLFFPSTPGSAEGKCCKNYLAPKPTNGGCQTYPGCSVQTVNGVQGCFTTTSAISPFQACSPAGYIWTNAVGQKQCCRNAQP